MSRSTIALVVAIVLGAVAVMLVNQQLKTMQSGQGGRVATMNIVLARRNLPAGTVINAGDVRRFATDPRLVWDNVITPETFRFVQGKVVSRYIPSGTPLERSFFQDEEAVEPITGSDITEGQRLISIGLSPVRAAGGILPVESRVDLLATVVRPGEQAGGDVAETKVLLSNVRVVAVNPGRGAKRSEHQLVVVLEVAPREAQLLAFAMEQAQGLTLIRRNPRDENREILEGVNKFNVFLLSDQLQRERAR